MAGKFHERFDIKVDVEAERHRFLARVKNLVFHRYMSQEIGYDHETDCENFVAARLGDPYQGNYLDVLAGRGDFHAHLRAIEAIYEYPEYASLPYQLRHRQALDNLVRYILVEANAIDIGVRWENGHFLPTGAPVLDEKLVNESLRWLRSKGYKTVVSPLEKALALLLASQSTPALRADVVTDAYESMEALAKIVTKRDGGLSANAELFVSTVKASDEYKRILKDYIVYANKFRHAARQGEAKPALTAAEAESFVYLTGLFIRLATY